MLQSDIIVTGVAGLRPMCRDNCFLCNTVGQLKENCVEEIILLSLSGIRSVKFSNDVITRELSC